DEGERGSRPCRSFREGGARAEDRHAMNETSVLVRVVVEEARDDDAVIGMGVDIAEEHLARIAGAEDDRSLDGARPRAAAEAALAADPERDPRRGEEQEGERPVREEDAPRDREAGDGPAQR